MVTRPKEMAPFHIDLGIGFPSRNGAWPALGAGEPRF
jgi:hypothetical protein